MGGVSTVAKANSHPAVATGGLSAKSLAKLFNAFQRLFIHQYDCSLIVEARL
jgi:hypothetical protein